MVLNRVEITENIMEGLIIPSSSCLGFSNVLGREKGEWVDVCKLCKF